MVIFLKKTILSAILTVGVTVAAAANGLNLHSQAVALLDADKDIILYSKSANDSMANASTTKILTCIVTLENSNLDEKVVVSETAEAQPQVKLGLKAGNEYLLKDLMYGMMLESFNDCAYAIAEYVGGSVEEFSKMMNKKANEIGCYNTYFLTPNGLDSEDEISFHHTTANDLCNIMKYCAWDSPMSAEFQKITQTLEYQFNNYDGNQKTFTNHNRLLTQTDCCISGKTGFTSKAGYCYVAAFEKNGKKMCIALLGCGWPNNKNYKWEDAESLLEYAMQTDDVFVDAESEKNSTKQQKNNGTGEKKENGNNVFCQKIEKFNELFTLNIYKFY